MVDIILIISFICLSAFFSASETAIFSLTTYRLRRMGSKDFRVKRIKQLLNKPTYLLSTIVFGNMLVNISIASLTTSIFVNLFNEKGVFLAIIFSGTIVLFLGEIFPKSIAINIPEKISLFSSSLLYLISKILYPLLIFIQNFSEKVSSLFFFSKDKEVPFTEEEFKTALLLGKREGQITKEEEVMITYILRFKETTAEQVMTHRVDIKGLDINWTQKEVSRILIENKHSKFPVYKDSLDNIIGILYSKDIFLSSQDDWKNLVRKPMFVPVSKRIGELLKVFLDSKESIAIVLDEYGGTAGLVTFEDIVEEIFGEIYDEYEASQDFIEKIDKNKYRVLGRTPLKKINLEFNLNIPEIEDTIAGFVLSKLGKIPEVGEKLEFKNVEFIVEKASRRRILSLLVEIK
ncbi:MAG: hemolysin family protein [Candidatus Omnitrophica bacterium]|nr:hemolysin family protein [Candidatus Omnitrophota bacterium]